MFGKVLVVLSCMCPYLAVTAASFIVEGYTNITGGVQLRYLDSETKTRVTLEDILREYRYQDKVLPLSEDELTPYLQKYNMSNEYFLQCDSDFLAPIKSILWQIKFPIIVGSAYPSEEIKKLKTFCELIKPEGDNVEFKKFLIKMLFQQNGVGDLYSEIRDYGSRFAKDLSLPSLRKDFNSMLDIVDPEKRIERFKK